MTAGRPRPGSDAPPGLGEVLDQHAELRDVIAQIRESPDVSGVAGLLRRLESLLEAHFAHEERSRVAARIDPAVAADLDREHAELRTRVKTLSAALAAADRTSPESRCSDLDDLLQRIERHDVRETALFGAGYGLQTAGAGTGPRVSSRALEVNLRRTAVDVVIPAEQQVLLEITADRYGIHEGTRKLLREINHPYVGWNEALDELRRRAMNDLPYHLASERAAEAIAVFCALFAKATREAAPANLREAAVRYQAFYWEKLVEQVGDRVAAFLPALCDAMAQLERLLRNDARLGAVSSPWLARVVRTLLEAGGDARPALERGVSLLALSLGQSYARWLALEDATTWWRETTGAEGGGAVPPPVAAISHDRLRACRQACERRPDERTPPEARARALLELPDDARIARGFLEAARAIAAGGTRRPELARVRWLVRMLGVEALDSVHEQVLAELGRLHGEVVSAPADFEHFVREAFGALRSSGLMASASALRMVSALGTATLASGDRERARCLIDEMLRCDFPRPRFTGFGDEWQVRSDPAHLAAIRTYLEVIGANPSLAVPLATSLVVELSLGGVLITDMDLFQKDVSRLLNSGVGPVYATLLHLLRRLPVYYSEIGAEGELRDVSSRIDEIDARRDPLCHFLRKQCHVESSPLLVDFVEAIARFWESGDPGSLEGYVPASLYARIAAEGAAREGLHAIVREVLGAAGDAVSLFDLEADELGRRLAACRAGQAVEREKVALLATLRRLLARKYELGHEDLLERLEGWHGSRPDSVRTLRRALERGDDETALDALLSILESLKETIVDERPTQGHEDIYRKRHIAVGIPSLYGHYREEKLEAVGLTFRGESLANVLFERLASAPDLASPTRSTLRRVARWLRLFLRAARVDGCTGRGLAAGIDTLERAIEEGHTSVDQFVNVFQQLSRGVEQLVRIRLRDPYEDALQRVIRRMIARGEIRLEPHLTEEEEILKISERFLRERIAENLGLQQLDRLVGRMLRKLVEARETLDRETADQLVSFDLERATLAIDRRPSPLDGPVQLGNKGFLIRRLARERLPVPPGFILTKEIFRCRKALRDWSGPGRMVADTLRQRLRHLERATGARFGDARRPLLLSVRSSSALSMPGVLDTFLNVGMNPALAGRLASRSRSAWSAWDSYRRFVQSWGMAHGLERGAFDGLMREAKQQTGVRKKAELPAERMKQLALRYRRFVEDHGIALADDAFTQLLNCVDLVLRSWDSERARIYREEVGVAEDWGTAVVVQSMVYGNLDQRSGTGVVLTCEPQRSSQDVNLYGDFVVQAQGDDIVGGLVETRPIRRGQRGAWQDESSLEAAFPRIYDALHRHAEHLVRDMGTFHQEIEFTFESEDPADLYILQTRDTVMSHIAEVTAFQPSPELDAAKLATGVGVGGGALCGRIAHGQSDIAGLRERFPDDPIVLLRPDTVPDDIPLIVQVAGMVTARGGSTSHAALVAQRLGRTCVVGCTGLEVDERTGRSKLGGRELDTGDPISISGLDGSVYWGRHPVETVRRHQLA